MTYKTMTITDIKIDIVTAYLRLRGPQTMLLENYPNQTGETHFSLIALHPVHEFQATGQQVTIDGKHSKTSDPLQALSDLVVTQGATYPDLPFTGGAIGYIGFDTIATYENLGKLPPDTLGMADIHMFIYDTFLIFDALTQTITIVSDDHYTQASDAQLADRIERVLTQLTTPVAAENKPVNQQKLTPVSNMTADQFKQIVRKAKQLITDGDLFQMVPSQRFSMPFETDPFDYFRLLCAENPTAYRYYLDFGVAQIIGASPERLVQVVGQQVVTNPIAGTRRRGQTSDEDHIIGQGLLNNEKERAEHQMLVDLARNDIGKVVTYGSVKVTKLLALQKYSYVMHLVSEVTGQLKPGTPAIAALKATLPAGTVSGAPKVRAIQRIYEMEPTRRGVYAGAIGYLSQNNQMDFAIAIRTMIVKDSRGYIQAGAGVVYDSIPEKEYDETLNKAKTLLQAGVKA